MNLRSPASVSLLIALVFADPSGAARALPPAPAPAKPRLVVLISVDQLRADYLRRFEDLFLPATSADGKPGGFRWLMTEGAYYSDARYTHLPLLTGPGHAVLSTGAPPSVTGIVANYWAVVEASGALTVVNCVGDPSAATVGGTGRPRGPGNLRVPTVGDELRLANKASKVVGIGYKDRGAILLTGHGGDEKRVKVVWFDDGTGGWVSSSAYFANGKLPPWVNTPAQQAIVANTFTDAGTWTPLRPEETARRSTPALLRKEFILPGLSAAFPHTFRKAEGASPFWAFTLAPQANDLVVETALAAVRAEALGQDDEPDLLALQLAANDYIGHAFGPYSPEVMDITLRTDAQLARLLAGLDERVPGGLDRVLVALSADHGVSPIQEELEATGLPVSRLSGEAILQRVERALDDRFGARDWVSPGGEYLHPNLWISPNAVLQASKLDGATPPAIRAEAASALRQVEGVYAAYTREDVLSGRLPDSRLGRAITAGFHPKVSGDVFVVLEPYRVVRSQDAAEHGAAWAYDTHVPILIAGPGIAPGRKDDPASPEDLAPTLALLLGIGPPGAAEGRLLRSALK